MGVVLIVVLVLLVLFLVYWFCIRRPDELTPATSLKHAHIASLENNMERYRLFWTQSVATSANTQNVVAKVSGGAETVLNADLLMATSEVLADFATGAGVEWWVRTYNEDKSFFVDSAHDSFVAANLEPLAPATGLGHAFVAHT